MITERQRNTMVDSYVLALLNSDRCNRYYVNIERLWEASGLNNKNLIDELLSEHENAAEDFKTSIFWDMIWLLKEEIVKNHALRSLFSDIFAKKYPKVDKFIISTEKKIIEGRVVKINDEDFRKFYDRNNYDESSYFFFRIYNSDLIISSDSIDSHFFERNYKFTMSHNFDTEAEVSENLIRFTDGNEDIVFKSPLFAKFVKRQKQALAEYLKVDVEKLAKFYDEVMTISENAEGDGISFDKSVFGCIASSMIEMIWHHGGSSYWLINIQSLNRRNKLGYRYRPDFDKLFERYCRASVLVDYFKINNNGEPFTALTLARKCAFIDMNALAISIGYLYMSDCMYQMYKQMQKQYYEDFSWEKYHDRDIKMRYDRVVEDFKSSLAIRDHQLQNLRQHYASLKESLEKKNDLVLLKELQDKERLLQISDEKDAEIERLKSVIASQNQLIEQLQVTPEESVPEEDISRFDVDTNNIIYRHKYLFVGDITNLGFEELRRKFPSSVFMESNTTNISQIQVDAVVYLIQAMGHSMHYKCKSTAALKDAKIIYFNGRGNVISLLKVMESAMLE